MRSKKCNRLARRHLQQVVNIFIFITHVQHRALITRPAALLTNQFHVRQETHLDGHRPVALASLTTPAGNVERKMSRRKSTLQAWKQILRESDQTPSNTSPDSSAASAQSETGPPSPLPPANYRPRAGRSIPSNFPPCASPAKLCKARRKPAWISPSQKPP